MFDKTRFGQKVKEIRIANGLQQNEFGSRIGLSKQSVSKIETYQGLTSIEALYAICKEFNVSADDLLGLK